MLQVAVIEHHQAVGCGVCDRRTAAVRLEIVDRQHVTGIANRPAPLTTQPQVFERPSIFGVAHVDAIVKTGNSHVLNERGAEEAPGHIDACGPAVERRAYYDIPDGPDVIREIADSGCMRIARADV